MDFNSILNVKDGKAQNPFALKDNKGNWVEGKISIDFLNNNFGQYDNATNMKANTESEGLKLFFDYLVDEGKL